jgi:hypothetical protein
MRMANKIVALLLLPMFLVSAPVFAQQARVVDASAMDQALAAKAASESAQRELVRRVLDRDDVRAMAARMGLSVEQADSAVAGLSGQELGTLAQHASAVEDAALAGGANTVVISVTTLLLILIIVILLAS